MSWPTASGCASASAWSVSHASVRKIVVKMFVPASKPSQSRVTTSNPAALSAWSIACSISGRPEVRSRPIVRAGVPAGVNPGSSSLMPVTSPPTVAAIGPTVSRLGASGQTPSKRHPAVGGLQARGAAAGGRDPDRPAGVGAERHVGLTGRDRDGGAARRAAGDQAGVERVDWRAEPRVGADRQHRQLVQVRLADDPRPGGPRPGQARGIGCGGLGGPLHRAGSGRGRHVRDVDEVLDRQPCPGTAACRAW